VNIHLIELVMEIGVKLGTISTTDIRIKRHIAYKVTEYLDKCYKSYIQVEPKVAEHLLEVGRRSGWKSD
jgi:hypothetical protein